MVLLQQIPYHGVLHCVVTVLKMRLSAHDTSLREFLISAPEGFRVLGAFERDEDVMDGLQHTRE